MSTQAPAVSISGDYNQVSVLTSASIGDFFEPPPESYRSQPVPLLEGARSLAADLAQLHLILLAAEPTVDRLDLAFQIAWHLNKLRAAAAPPPSPSSPAPDPTLPGSSSESAPPPDTSAGAAPALPLRQWASSSTRELTPALRRLDHGCIVVLPQLQPHHFGFDLGGLQQMASAQELYLIGVVEDQLGWEHAFEYQHRPFWREVPLRIYTPRYLVGLLKRILTTKKSQGLLPTPIWEEALLRQAIGDAPILEVARRLGSPLREEAFALLLCDKATCGPVTHHDVEDAIVQAQNDDTLLRQWFVTLPDLRDQLVALTIHLFDGFLEDQFFEATDLLIEQVWSRREPSLHSLDHQHLNRLDRFFFYGQSADGELVRTRSAGQRYRLLRIIWPTHRRYVLSALPVLIQLVRESAARQPRSWKLYGTYRRREILRKSIGATLSDIGLISVRDVEESLLRLAAESDPAVQAVAANAMARWREFRQQSQLYRMLETWLNDSAIERMVQGFATSIDGQPLEHGMRSVQLTAGLAIAYAAEVDPPNGMDGFAVALLIQIAQDPDLELRKDFVRLALSRIIPIHLIQLRDLLCELAYQPELHPTIARILQDTYLVQPQWIVDTLRSWYERGRTGAGMDRPSRTALLMLVCTAFGRLDYTQTFGTIDPAEVCELMTVVLELEGDPGVRDAARRTAVRLPDEHQVQLQTLMTRLSTEEMDSIVKELAAIYMEQRRGLRGGTGKIRIDGTPYHVWSQPSQRPLTAVEQQALRWLRDPGDQPHQQVARQIALRALVAFRERLDDGVAYSRPSEVMPEEAPALLPPPPPLGEVGLYPRTFYEHTIVPWLTTRGPGRRRLRPVVRGAVSEVVFQSQRADAITQRLISDLTARSSTPDVATVGQLLHSTLSWARRRNSLLYASVALAVLALLILGLLISSLW